MVDCLRLPQRLTWHSPYLSVALQPVAKHVVKTILNCFDLAFKFELCPSAQSNFEWCYQNKKAPYWVLLVLEATPQVFAFGEDSLTLRLLSGLTELRVGNVN